VLSVSFFLIPTGTVYEMLNVISALSNVIADCPKVCHDVILLERQSVCDAKPIAIAIARLIVCPAVENVTFYGMTRMRLDELNVMLVGNPTVFFDANVPLVTRMHRQCPMVLKDSVQELCCVLIDPKIFLCHYGVVWEFGHDPYHYYCWGVVFVD